VPAAGSSFPAVPFIWLALGALTLTISNGRWMWSLAAWLAPLFLLHFLDKQRPLRGLLIGFIAVYAAYALMWYGMIPVPAVLYYPIAAAYAATYYVAFVAHRLAAPRLKFFTATLVFPSTLVAAEFVVQRFVAPYGSWGSVAYSQTGLLPVIQIASVTGLYGVSFIVAWFGSVASLLWSGRHGWPAVRAGTVTYVTTMVILLLFGGLRMGWDIGGEQTVSVAAITPARDLSAEFDEAFVPFNRGKAATEAEKAALRESVKALNGDLIERSRREARSGARIIAWSETAGRIPSEEEAAFIAEGARLAMEEKVYLVMAYGSWDPARKPPLENKLTAIDPSGRVIWQYLKSRPIFGSEAPFVVRGDDVIHSMDTPHGRIAGVICHDLDFPGFIRAAGRAGVDVLFAPSDDWMLIAPIHARMAVVRAVENGFNLVRPTSSGHSIVIDALGRVTATLDDHTTDDGVLVSDVPTKRVRTVFPHVSDLFAWLSLVVCLSLSGVVLSRRFREGRICP
jgi:apolipoprotein N-acyltransferase